MRCVMQANQINWPTTIVNLGLWTRPGIPTKATRLKTHHLVRFFGEFFFALLAFMSGDKLVWGGQFLFHSERANPTQSRPMRQNHQKPLYDEIKNFFTQNSQS